MIFLLLLCHLRLRKLQSDDQMRIFLMELLFVMQIAVTCTHPLLRGATIIIQAK